MAKNVKKLRKSEKKTPQKLYTIYSVQLSEVTHMVTVNGSECVGCGACADVCPQGAIVVEDIAVIDAGKCVDCGACIDACPSEAIEN